MTAAFVWGAWFVGAPAVSRHPGPDAEPDPYPRTTGSTAERRGSRVPAVHARNEEGARDAAIDAGMAARDLELQYRPVTEVDLARFDLWTKQLLVDSGSVEADTGHTAGDVAALTRVWDRIAHTVDKSVARDIEAKLSSLEKAAKKEDVARAAGAATRLNKAIAGLQSA